LRLKLSATFSRLTQSHRPPFFILTEISGNTYIFHECRRWKRGKGRKKSGKYGCVKDIYLKAFHAREKENSCQPIAVKGVYREGLYQLVW